MEDKNVSKQEVTRKKASKIRAFREQFGLPKETLFHEFFASLKETPWQPGKLYFSDHFVTFSSKNAKIVLPLDDIEEVRNRKSVFNTGFSIVARGVEYNFTNVVHRDKAVQFLELQRQKQIQMTQSQPQAAAPPTSSSSSSFVPGAQQLQPQPQIQPQPMSSNSSLAVLDPSAVESGSGGRPSPVPFSQSETATGPAAAGNNTALAATTLAAMQSSAPPLPLSAAASAENPTGRGNRYDEQVRPPAIVPNQSASQQLQPAYPTGQSLPQAPSVNVSKPSLQQTAPLEPSPAATVNTNATVPSAHVHSTPPLAPSVVSDPATLQASSIMLLEAALNSTAPSDSSSSSSSSLPSSSSSSSSSSSVFAQPSDVSPSPVLNSGHPVAASDSDVPSRQQPHALRAASLSPAASASPTSAPTFSQKERELLREEEQQSQSVSDASTSAGTANAAAPKLSMQQPHMPTNLGAINQRADDMSSGNTDPSAATAPAAFVPAGLASSTDAEASLHPRTFSEEQQDMEDAIDRQRRQRRHSHSYDQPSDRRFDGHTGAIGHTGGASTKFTSWVPSDAVPLQQQQQQQQVAAAAGSPDGVDDISHAPSAQSNGASEKPRQARAMSWSGVTSSPASADALPPSSDSALPCIQPNANQQQQQQQKQSVPPSLPRAGSLDALQSSDSPRNIDSEFGDGRMSPSDYVKASASSEQIEQEKANTVQRMQQMGLSPFPSCSPVVQSPSPSPVVFDQLPPLAPTFAVLSKPPHNRAGSLPSSFFSTSSSLSTSYAAAAPAGDSSLTKGTSQPRTLREWEKKVLGPFEMKAYRTIKLPVKAADLFRILWAENAVFSQKIFQEKEGNDQVIQEAWRCGENGELSRVLSAKAAIKGAPAWVARFTYLIKQQQLMFFTRPPSAGSADQKQHVDTDPLCIFFASDSQTPNVPLGSSFTVIEHFLVHDEGIDADTMADSLYSVPASAVVDQLAQQHPPVPACDDSALSLTSHRTCTVQAVFGIRFVKKIHIPGAKTIIRNRARLECAQACQRYFADVEGVCRQLFSAQESVSSLLASSAESSITAAAPSSSSFSDPSPPVLGESTTSALHILSGCDSLPAALVNNGAPSDPSTQLLKLSALPSDGATPDREPRNGNANTTASPVLEQRTSDIIPSTSMNEAPAPQHLVVAEELPATNAPAFIAEADPKSPISEGPEATLPPLSSSSQPIEHDYDARPASFTAMSPCTSVPVIQQEVTRTASSPTAAQTSPTAAALPPISPTSDAASAMPAPGIERAGASEMPFLSPSANSPVMTHGDTAQPPPTEAAAKVETPSSYMAPQGDAEVSLKRGREIAAWVWVVLLALVMWWMVHRFTRPLARMIST